VALDPEGTMQRSIRLAPVALVCLLAPGCITINTFGRGEEPLVETVVYGERGPKVLLLDVDGLISDVSVEGPLGFGERESSVARVREQLDKARGDAELRGVLLRINSPGGSVTASDVLYREVRAFKEERRMPVVAQLMGVAASGGYYVAMAADVVLAHPTTITGSIGVISAGVNFSGLMQRYGVTDQTLVGGEKKDAGSPLRPMTAEERAYLQAVIDDLHERFRAVVSEGRPALGDARVRALSDGRVYTARQAERAGLVDGISYLPGAIDELERRVGAPELRVVAYHREREWRSNLYSTAPAAPTSQANPAARLGLGGGPAFLYLWWPGGL
jgi:protease-4